MPDPSATEPSVPTSPFGLPPAEPSGDDAARRRWHRRGYLLVLCAVLFVSICVADHTGGVLSAFAGLLLMLCGFVVGLVDGESKPRHPRGEAGP